MAASLVLLGMGATTLPAHAADLPPSAAGITKTNDLGGKPLVPGQEFKYELVLTCLGITAECVNYKVTDQLPKGLELTDLPPSTDTQIVTYDAATGLLTIEFKLPLQQPAGSVGMPAGSPVSLEIGMRLPLDSPLLDGQTVSNTAVASGDNFPEKESTSDVVVSIPKVINPVATKGWSDGSAVAGSGEASTVTLGMRNASSTSAAVTHLSVTDDNAATYEHFNFTSAAVDTFPAGADTATLRVKTTAGWVNAGSLSAAGEFALPAGINPADVLGTEVTFSNSAGKTLPYDATGGTVKIGMELRDTLRSTGETIAPAAKLTIDNCAVPSAAEAAGDAVTGTAVCAPYQILPATAIVTGAKKFFADENGDWTHQNNEHAVMGQPSGVTATVDATNGSPFPVKELTIIEPDPDSPSELSKVDLETVRFRPPAGATSVTLTVGYSNGTPLVRTYTIAELEAQGGVENILRAGADVTSVAVTYTGVDADGNPSIAEGATAGLDLHGKLNDTVTEADVTDGIANCAAVKADDGRVDGQGTASGKACQSLPVEPPRATGEGTKTVGQTSVPEGQPIPFTLTVKNNGNIAMTNPAITDPPMNPDGTPMEGYANPFEQLMVTEASISKAAAVPGVAIEIYVGGAWVPYEAGSANLEQAKGVRASMDGTLAPGSAFTLNLVTERRPGIANDVSIRNCFTTGVEGDFTPSDPACAPAITTGPADAAANLNKNIEPGTLPEHVAGLPTQYADVSLSISNTGNLSAKTLDITDEKFDFFDAVDFSAIKSVKFPRGANRIQIDVLTPTGWVSGTPAANGAFPAGVDPADVRGIKATFSSNGTGNNGFLITPCNGTGDTDCVGTVTYTVSPREYLRSKPTTKVPTVLKNSATGQYWTEANPDGPVDIGKDVEATLELIEGSSELSVQKTPNTVVTPGQKAPFNLKVTNSGSGNITGLKVKDLLPAGIAFDDSYAGDNGLPFKIVSVQVPANTAALPTPVFNTVSAGEHISELNWDFSKNADGSDFLFAPGSTFVIQIQATLEPGLSAGEKLKNTMGATATNPDLACQGSTDTEHAFGEGTYCTDSAELTVSAGAFFQSRKWVSGTDSLGWYNTQTKNAVAVGDTSCPVTTNAAGTKFTAYPCVALVNPGETFKYLLRLVNAGTESGTDMRVIDTFPAAGDKGVVAGEDRGTEWDKRPTLASEPVLTGPGKMTTLFTDKTEVCSKDLDMGGAGSDKPQCADGDWAAAYGPGVTAAQFRIAFDPKIAPGQQVEIAFDMKSPLDVTPVSDPTVAWNSFGHAETTDRDGSPHVLPPTEPIKVGVALAYGDLVLAKKIGENPSKLPVENVAFTFHVSCAVTPAGGSATTVLDKDYQVTSLASVRITGIPANANCRVWEVDSMGGTSDHDAAHPFTTVIKPGLDTPSVETATITNNFPDAIVALQKKVTGAAAAYAQDSYPMELFCTFNGAPVGGYNPKTVQVPANGEPLETAVPPGSDCHVVETDNGGATEVSYVPAKDGDNGSSGTVVTQDGKPVKVTITNDFRTGSLSVNKEVTGAGAPELAQGPFTYSVVCSFNGKVVLTREITIPKGTTGQSAFTSEELDGLPVSAICEVSETDNGGADGTPGPVTVVIPDGTNVIAGFTGEHANVFTAGTVDLKKVLTGDAAGEDYAKNAVFTVLVTCQRDATDAEGNPIRTTVFSKSVNIKGGESSGALTGADGKPVKLPVGTSCYGTETNAGGASTSAIDHSTFENGAKVLVSQTPSDLQTLHITATNTFGYGTLSLNKKVDGAAAGYASDRKFELSLNCTLDQGTGKDTDVVTDRLFTIKGGESISVGKLPVGAKCWVAETNNGGASAVEIDHKDSATAAVVAVDSTVALTVTNTFDAGELTVSKKVVNGAAGPYTFALVCTTEQGAVSLAKSDAAFSLKDGEAKTISVPNGAQCTVTETNVPQGDTVTYQASTGGTDGKVAVNGSAKLQVTNTFKVAPVAPTEPVQPTGPGDELSHTGADGVGAVGLAAAGALLLGLFLVARNRRKSKV